MTPTTGPSTQVNDSYQLGHLAYQTDGNGTLLATFTYDSQGVPVSVVVGTDPTNAAARYYYVYNAHGDVVNLVDSSGNTPVIYAYDTWGNLTSITESFANGWTNPYRYDGRDGVRYDASDGLYWMSVRAYDPTIGRFISRDPLGRAPLFFADQPYAYAGNNPISNVDPSGQYRAAGFGSTTHESWKQTKRHFARIAKHRGCDSRCQRLRQQEAFAGHVRDARAIARKAAAYFGKQAATGMGLNIVPLGGLTGTTIVSGIIRWIESAFALDGLFFLYTSALAPAVLIYDLVAANMQTIFQNEAAASDNFWLTARGLASDYGEMQNATNVGGLVMLAVSTILTVLLPEGIPFWGILLAATNVAMTQLFDRMQQYIDQEEQLFGYEQSW